GGSFPGSGEVDENMLGSLHEMLRAWRKMQHTDGGAQGGMPAPQGPPGAQGMPDIERPQLSSKDMLSVLSLFQTDLPVGLKNALKSSDRSLAQQLKRELITGAAALGISQD